ncbi:protein EVI2B [Pipra filicauda]|uniref:Protein EVI2B n=1 Tax=Pipra filicauda TaxID=649802 RepID=A0A7R5L1V4_9PASS|nr:protein EVI2B [Pipra filicauda]
MASNQVILVLFCGEIWKSLSTAAPGPSLPPSGPALAVTTPRVPTGEEEAGDGSWVAGLLIGIVLLGMILAIMVILLWKCCLRPGPALANSHWAGRSPFADGDTPDLFLDSDQDNKRSSVLFMLPWKLKQGPNLQLDPTGSENPSQHTTSNENGQLPPLAGTAAPSTDPPPAPSSETGSAAGDSCPHPDAPPESHDLPPPPDWLQEPPEDPSSDPSSDPSKHSAFHSEAEEPLPPPPELLLQETGEPLPQPEHPLETAKSHLQNTPHSS